jgi:hypothetical protein
MTALNGAVDTIRTTLGTRVVSLSPQQRRELVKMGGKTRAFCDGAIAALQSNSASLPPSVDVAELTDDMADFDKLNAFASDFTTLSESIDDTLKAISSDVMTTSIFGVGILKALNKGSAALDTLLSDLSTLRRAKPAKKQKATP